VAHVLKVHLSRDGTGSPDKRAAPLWCDAQQNWTYISTADVDEVTCELCLRKIERLQKLGLPLVES
jgi:hypothetical protein